MLSKLSGNANHKWPVLNSVNKKLQKCQISCKNAKDNYVGSYLNYMVQPQIYQIATTATATTTAAGATSAATSGQRD